LAVSDPKLENPETLNHHHRHEGHANLMNITATPQESKFRNSAPPGARPAAPAPRTEVKDAVELRFDEQGPETQGLSLWQKVVGGAMAGVAGLAAFAPQAAHAAPADALVTQSIAQSDGLEVTVLPRGTARVDLLRQVSYRSGIGRGGSEASNIPYSDVGVHLGRGVFHDTNGNLVLVPSMAAGWNDSITDFKRVELDIPGRNMDVTRYFNTTHVNRGTTDRTVYVDNSSRNTLDVHNHNDHTKYEVLSNGVQYRGERGVEWRVTQNGNTLHVDGPDDSDVNLTYSGTNIDLRGPHLQNSITLGSNSIITNGTGPDYQVTRSAAGEVISVNARGASDATITQQAPGVIRVTGAGNASYTINPAEFMNRTTINFNELSRMIEEAEPGFVQRHPLIMGLLEYATANPGLVGEGEHDDISGLLQAGTGIATAGGVVESGIALSTGARALSLAENARALAASALRAQAAAQAAGQAGNLSQAAALGNQARTLAGQARNLGGQATALGESARNTAQVARVLTGVAGAIEIVDGTIDIQRGAENRAVVEGALLITEALHERLTAEQTGAALERTQEDYTKVMQILRGLQRNADKQITVGGLKIGCGGLLLISALAGGAVIPPILGAVGAICTVGTAAYEHWDEITAFFRGEELQPDPTLRNVLPEQVQGEVLFRLD
jgi:hypothetical protein